jgi:alginate O-acetyltransferase complex protein AlgI
MVFSSTVFLFIFLPLTFFLNLILPEKYRNGMLLFFSLLFYAWGEPVFVLIMLFSITVNYGIGVAMAKGNPKRRKAWLVTAVVANLALLFVFKYTNFFVRNLNSFFHLNIRIPEIPLPIGISFFTFQAMSYVIDIYKGTVKAEQKFLNTALYISLFPQLIAGPIVKYNDIQEQLEKREISARKIKEGIRRFIVGLGKKLLIANLIGKTADAVFSMDPNSLNVVLAWVGAVAYCIQIYFDFSGYSDMAIGLGKMFGFDFKENFNYPYTATSITDFWRRWHISLTSWFREYLYIPLGGNRKGDKRTLLNIFIVYLCTGFWHGAEWTCLVWGIFHAFFMILERAKIIQTEKFKYRWLARLYVLLVVLTGFVMFRAENLTQGVKIIGKLFTGFSFQPGWHVMLYDFLSPLTVLVFFLSFIAATPVLTNLLKDFTEKLTEPKAEGIRNILSIALFLLCIMAISTETYNPFIYFRF